MIRQSMRFGDSRKEELPSKRKWPTAESDLEKGSPFAAGGFGGEWREILAAPPPKSHLHAPFCQHFSKV